MPWRRGLGLVLVLAMLAGCATTQTAAGTSALREGRPGEAAEHFKEALADDPNRVDAKIGLGISRYFGERYHTMFDTPIAEKRSAFGAYLDGLTSVVSAEEVIAATEALALLILRSCQGVVSTHYLDRGRPETEILKLAA